MKGGKEQVLRLKQLEVQTDRDRRSGDERCGREPDQPDADAHRGPDPWLRQAVVELAFARDALDEPAGQDQARHQRHAQRRSRIRRQLHQVRIRAFQYERPYPGHGVDQAQGTGLRQHPETLVQAALPRRSGPDARLVPERAAGGTTLPFVDNGAERPAVRLAELLLDDPIRVAERFDHRSRLERIGEVRARRRDPHEQWLQRARTVGHGPHHRASTGIGIVLVVPAATVTYAMR